MQNKVYLRENYFDGKERVFLQNGTLTASTFVYDSGVKALRIANERGYIIVLPFMGQMIWRANFDGKELTMKSIHEEPLPAKQFYGETYGCFLMHCGLTAMGNPTAEDTHTPHGELPIAQYFDAYLLTGKDEKGRYIAIGGSYRYMRAFEHNYEFCPLVKLYENSAEIEVEVNITNHKDMPLEYFYLCHINHRPIDGAKLCYTADRKNITPHHEVPDGYPQGELTNAYLDRLDKDVSIMDEVGAEGQAYAPEIVFTCKYDADENGDAYTMQVNPDGTATYVCHKPSELPFGVRWIARTKDEDAMGMLLPATAQHMGYLYCKKNGLEKYLASGEKLTYHIRTGLLNKEQATKLQDKIKKLGF